MRFPNICVYLTRLGVDAKFAQYLADLRCKRLMDCRVPEKTHPAAAYLNEPVISEPASANIRRAWASASGSCVNSNIDASDGKS